MHLLAKSEPLSLQKLTLSKVKEAKVFSDESIVNSEITMQNTVCLVDDDQNLIEALGELLKPLCATQCFNSTHRALGEVAKGFSPAVMVVDINMPDLDGLEFIKKCRELRYQGVFIVASGHISQSNLLVALNLGVSNFLEKPFSALEFRLAIDDAVGGRYLKQTG